MIILLLCILFGISVSAAQLSDLDAASWRKLGKRELRSHNISVNVLFGPEPDPYGLRGVISYWTCRGGNISTTKTKDSMGNVVYQSYMNGYTGTYSKYVDGRIVDSANNNQVHAYLYKKCASLWQKQLNELFKDIENGEFTKLR